MSEDNGIYISLLLEFYGSLLSERQKEIIDYSVNDDLSLSEIAEITGITRQGVRDAIRKAAVQLEDYEKKLGMYKAYVRRQELGDKLVTMLAEYEGGKTKCSELEALVKEICG